MKKAAVLPASGIGDALLMLIASARLSECGYQVVTFQPQLSQMQRWFPTHTFAPLPPMEALPALLSSFDRVIVQNDNSATVKALLRCRETTGSTHLSVFYPTYEEGKHQPMHGVDYVFDPTRPMAHNIAEAIASLLLLPNPSLSNQITPPPSLTHRLHTRQVILHPTSTDPHRTWTKEKFLLLAKRLKGQGFTPLFAVGPNERPYWKDIEEAGFLVPDFPSLDALACCVYESGFVIGNESLLGHLGSNLNLPTLVVAGDAKQMRLWRPGWLAGRVITPSPWIPNTKGLRLRRRYWQTWISTGAVMREFGKLTCTL